MTLEKAVAFAAAAAAEAGGVAGLAAPVRTVVLVHGAQGVIDNGGLRYFFEADFPGKPDYGLFVEAYGAIGAEDAARVLAEAEDHHPDLHLEGYRRVWIEISTHAIGGLSENDFILAAKIDRLPIALRGG